MLAGLTKWLYVGQVKGAQKATRDGDVCKIMMVFAKQQGSC